jgi:Fe-S cluster assembly protein SufD
VSPATTAETFLAAFDARPGAGAPAWLDQARRTAMARFAERGLPTPRDERWRYTSLAPLLDTALDLAGGGPGPAEEVRDELLPGDPAWPRLVFADGRPAATSPPALPGGARLERLAGAVAQEGEPLRPYLETAADALPDGLAALNAAFWRDGACLVVPDGVVLDVPVLAAHVGGAPGAARALHPRNLVVLGRDSRAVLVECYAGRGGDVYLTNATTEVVLGPGAVLEQVRVVVESPRAFHVGRTRARLAAGSRWTSTVVVFGGRLVRHDTEARLAEPGAAVHLRGLTVAGGRQHVDTQTVVDHAAPRGTSRQLYKGVLDGRARGVFDGRVTVRRGADGTDAHQTNRNLLLGEGVEVASKPQLEIFADDVKCSHGAADGQVAPEAIFYLRSRGLGEAAARALLCEGFAREVLEAVGPASLRAWLAARLSARLARGRVADPEEERT